MKKYTAMFYWENNKYLNKLINFRTIFHKYANAYEKQEQDQVSKLRAELIANAPLVEEAFLGVRMPYWMEYGSSAGGTTTISITHSLPELVKKQFTYVGSSDDTLAKVDDMYIRAISLYTSNNLHSILNIINPFLWINALVKLLFLPLFTILDIKPANQETGIWWILQFILRIPAYYVTVIHPLIILFGKTDVERQVFNAILNYF